MPSWNNMMPDQTQLAHPSSRTDDLISESIHLGMSSLRGIWSCRRFQCRPGDALRCKTGVNRLWRSLLLWGASIARCLVAFVAIPPVRRAGPLCTRCGRTLMRTWMIPWRVTFPWIGSIPTSAVAALFVASASRRTRVSIPLAEPKPEQLLLMGVVPWIWIRPSPPWSPSKRPLLLPSGMCLRLLATNGTRS